MDSIYLMSLQHLCGHTVVYPLFSKEFGQLLIEDYYGKPCMGCLVQAILDNKNMSSRREASPKSRSRGRGKRTNPESIQESIKRFNQSLDGYEGLISALTPSEAEVILQTPESERTD